MKNSISLNKDKVYKYSFTGLGIFIIFLFWIIISSIIDNELVFPSISTTFAELKNLLSSLSTYKIILFTFIRISISLIIGIFAGILLGTLSAIFKWLNYLLLPIIKIMRVLPIASIILIILMIFGMKGFNDITFAPIVISLMLIIPIIYEAVYNGIINIDSTLIDVAKIETKSKYDLVRYSYIPLINNELKIGISQSIGLSVKVMVMAEYVSQTQTSIGYALQYAKSWARYDSVFAWTIILIVICLLLEIPAKLLNRNNK